MISEQDAVYRKHIRDAILQIQRYVEGVSEPAFLEDEMLQDALLRQLSIIGEATGQRSEETKGEAPSVPWTDIYGMRNKLVHDYFGVDLEAVWDIVRDDRPPLLTGVKTLLGDSER